MQIQKFCPWPSLVSRGFSNFPPEQTVLCCDIVIISDITMHTDSLDRSHQETHSLIVTRFGKHQSLIEEGMTHARNKHYLHYLNLYVVLQDFIFDINLLQNRKSQIFRELNTRCKARNIRGVFEGRVYLSCHVYYSFIVLKYCPLVK